MKLNYNAVAYSATTMAAVMMNSVFQFYYVKLFISHYRISTYWFNLSQTIYMIWNAINDPLFGYFQDHSNLNCLKHRQLNIFYGAPFFALSFLLPWYGWGSETSPDWVVGIHLLVCLAVYDGLFTFVLLAQCSLSAEISKDQKQRQTILKYSQVASILGNIAVFATEFSSDQMRNISGLQSTCIVIAACSWLLLSFSGKYVTVDVSRIDHCQENTSSWSNALVTSLQILKNKHFTAFVIMNFCQVFHATYCANFFSIFREKLLEDSVLPAILQSFAAGSAFVLPPIIVLLIEPFISRFGSYWIINCSFIIKMFMSMVLYTLGYASPILVALYMILDSCFVGAAFSLFNLSVSDIIDDDERRNKRSYPVSSMIFGLNALITKPAQSIAPMIIVYLLKQYGYQDGIKADNIHASAELKDMMFSIMVGLPFVLSVVQLFCWRFFNLGIGRSIKL